MRRLPVRIAIILVCVLAGMLTATAQLTDLDEPSPVFPQDIFRIDPPVLVTLCHFPPGNPAYPQTIEVAQEAVPAHLAHGDLLGECPYECDGAPAPVAQTGQTRCWGPGSTPTTDCAGTGQDGEYQDHIYQFDRVREEIIDMSKIASVLKEEITRLARKEGNARTTPLRWANA